MFLIFYHGLVKHQCSLNEFGNVADVSSATIGSLKPDPTPRVICSIMMVVICFMVMVVVICFMVMVVSLLFRRPL